MAGVAGDGVKDTAFDTGFYFTDDLLHVPDLLGGDEMAAARRRFPNGDAPAHGRETRQALNGAGDSLQA